MIRVLGEAGYSQSHYWLNKYDECGLAVTDEVGRPLSLGPCRWPKEPGLPWCNRHILQFLTMLQTSNYTVQQARDYFGSQPGITAEHVETIGRRYELFLATTPVRPAVESKPVSEGRIPSGNTRKPRSF